MFEEFRRIGKLLFQEGLVDACGGNISVREGDKVFITHRDAMLGDLREKDIVEVGLEAGEQDSSASREINAHRAVYKQSGAKAIVHAHPANTIAVSITDNKIVPQDAEGTFVFKSAPILRVRSSIGSEETARMLPAFLGNENVVAVLKGHGSFAIGDNLEEAYKRTSALENSCKVTVAVRASGGRSAPRDRERELGRPPQRKPAIPPALGVMDRSRNRSRNR
ncbi:hypothetical protein A3H38_00320 [candidate division WOR-1 bacterium RIFCSPLOWO2_02_FULL_46_20]|uniref:Class II aldolase/adducin N-terminal domain-containing protein n=2 Tax=Saganbacteria TaxID=1703751 RepID=A0A1F4R4V4_UNCSA|nr:MAG: hypothetical protein A3J44_06740 [candidate division WOR-1 bacterium RIFCSPHIGHO2_02_FULL_45_12]OGC03202.1 MAG: hypothetical protein A3H38_00320 [candidate division WOR-1 bacterium RIFCSPLOWO2_02_FULL_46_20]OGC09844.1 MAG: hypothetical protein A3F86_04085 [candidate division WOR-1 bacterium RIFCSPLOWO2_12_FULL_45_9]